MNNNKRNRIIIQKIIKNVHSKKRECLVCGNIAINSHLLQKNGILNNISNNGHIIQLKPKDFSIEHSDGILDIRKIGINQGMSYSLFCSYHDTEIFKKIEQELLNVNEYYNQMLFSYRAICAEVRKKEIVIDIYSRILNSSHFSKDIKFLEFIKISNEANEKGKITMQYYKNLFEKEIFNSSEEKFYFRVFEYDFIPISASAVYTPINPKIHNLKYFSKSSNILTIIFINLIPINNKLYLLLGYHKDHLDDWIEKYIKSWENISRIELSKKLSDIVSTKIETWAISPEYYEKIDIQEIKKFKRYWNTHTMNLQITQKIDFNLFQS